jgi:hypothetical protein
MGTEQLVENYRYIHMAGKENHSEKRSFTSKWKENSSFCHKHERETNVQCQKL